MADRVIGVCRNCGKIVHRGVQIPGTDHGYRSVDPKNCNCRDKAKKTKRNQELK